MPVILKFGGAAVASPSQFVKIAEIIKKKFYQNEKIVVVLSAMAHTTDQLIELANLVSKKPPQREYDMLISVGERISISLLAMALAEKGVEAISFTGSQSGIITCMRHSEARIIDVRPKRVLAALNEGKIAIVAGFQGVSEKGEITTLGRGGSDTSAVAMGIALSASHVEFYKDVDGIYTNDPKKCGDAEHLSHLSYDEAYSIVSQGAKVLHQRCLTLAKENSMPLVVKSFLSDNKHTLIGDMITASMKAEYEKCLDNI